MLEHSEGQVPSGCACEAATRRADAVRAPRQFDPSSDGEGRCVSREFRNRLPAPAPSRHRSASPDGAPLRLLLIEDNRVDACVIRECLACADDASIELEAVQHLSTGLSRLKDGGFDAVVLDLNLPDSEGVDTVIRTHACVPRTPIIVLTGIKDKRAALQAVREGAEDYLCKNELEPKLLLRTVRYAIERAAHRHVDKKLQDEETRYRRLLEAVTSYTYSVTFDDGASFTRHGLGCLATTGYSPDEYAADSYLWFRVVHPDDRERVTRYVAGILAGEKLPPIEHRILHKDGSTRWIRNTIIHGYDALGRLSGYDGVVEDISQRKQAEEAEQAARRELQAQRVLRIASDRLRSLGEMVTSIAHELKQPLFGVRGLAEHLLIANARDAVLEKMSAGGTASPPRPIRLRTLACCRQGHERTEIQVIDEGSGIPNNLLARVFEPFFTTKGPDQGTGIGLTVCKQIVEQFGGTIGITSQAGLGTTVTLSFPAEAQDGKA